jgi:type I restriction enzyme S subunit
MKAVSKSIGWETVPLGEIAEVKLGKMLDKSKHRGGRPLPYLRNINVRWGSVDTTDLLEMNFDDDELDRFGLKTGDVLVCEGGEPGRAAVWNDSVPNIKYQKAIHRIRFKETYEPRLLVYLLELLAKTGRLERRFTGSTIKHFTREAIVRLPIPVPPLDEQERIVAEIEKQFTRLDAGVSSLKRVQTALKRYRASVLKAACEGECESVTLGSLSLQSSYGTSVKCSYQSPGIPVLRIPNIQNGRIDLTDLKFATSEVDLNDENALKPNDFLIVRTNGSKDLIGRGAVVLSEFKRPHFFASYLIRFRIRDRDTAKWLSTVWNSENVRNQILTIAATSAGQYNVNQTNLSKISIPLPPLEERTRIVAEVERRLSVIEELEMIVSTELQRAVRLRQSILKRAFGDANQTPG